MRKIRFFIGFVPHLSVWLACDLFFVVFFVKTMSDLGFRPVKLRNGEEIRRGAVTMNFRRILDLAAEYPQHFEDIALFCSGLPEQMKRLTVGDDGLCLYCEGIKIICSLHDLMPMFRASIVNGCIVNPISEHDTENQCMFDELEYLLRIFREDAEQALARAQNTLALLSKVS